MRALVFSSIPVVFGLCNPDTEQTDPVTPPPESLFNLSFDGDYDAHVTSQLEAGFTQPAGGTDFDQWEFTFDADDLTASLLVIRPDSETGDLPTTLPIGDAATNKYVGRLEFLLPNESLWMTFEGDLAFSQCPDSGKNVTFTLTDGLAYDEDDGETSVAGTIRATLPVSSALHTFYVENCP